MKFKLSNLTISIALLLMACTEKEIILDEPVIEEEEVVAQFKNPVGGFEADPWVLLKDGYYYYCATNNVSIEIKKSKNLHDVAGAIGKIVWLPTPSGEIKNTIWAPEIHFIAGKWYIYATGSPCGDFTQCSQVSFVLEGTTTDPLGTYEYKGIIAEGIDGTVLQTDSVNYFTWMRIDNGITKHISIAKMKNPWEIDGEIVKVSKEPFLPWETRDQYTNEGPQFLTRGDSTLVVYSASASWTEWYCLGVYINTSGNIMTEQAWEKYPEPLFEKSETNRVFGPGHCSFTKSPDGLEDWILYHGLSDRNGGWEKRTPRIQPFTWSSEGLPEFGEPVSVDQWLDFPSGTN